MKKEVLFLLSVFSILFFAAIKVKSADIQSKGVPYVQNYTKAMYQSGNQNWSIVKGKNGVMYFGNSEGLMTFDGKYWQLHQMPNRQIVRAVASDNKGNIFAGGFGEFGYWAYNKKGKFSYTSLIKKIPKNFELKKEEIWKIYVEDNRVILQSFSTIYIYENGKIEAVKAPNQFLFLFKVGKRFFVEVLSEGLYELKGKNLNYIPGSNILGNTGVLSILPYKKDSYLIGTARNGLFIFDGNKIKPWVNQATDFLKTYQLNNGAVLLNKYIAYGTILNGVIIIDQAGNIVQQINKSSGLQNNTVLSLYLDDQENLWASLDNGIDRIEINSSLYFYLDKTGKFGTVYSSVIHDHKIYLATNQGLFYSNWSANTNHPFQSFDFKLIRNSQGQVWDLSKIDGQLICGHNNATYLVNGDQIEKISEISGGWVIRKLPSNPGLLIQGTYNGPVIYKKNGAGKWVFSHKISGFGETSRYIEQENKNQVWVSHAYKGLYKLTLSDDLKKVTSVKSYDERFGLPYSYNINVFNLDNRIVFSSDSGVYVYEDLNDRFIPYEALNKKLGSFTSSNKIIKADGKKYWFIDHGRVALADLTVPGKLSIDSNRFSILDGRMVQNYENISQISNTMYLISVDDGFVIFSAENAQELNNKIIIPRVLIRKVENTTAKIVTLTESANRTEAIKIPFGQNNLRISFSLPFYSQAKLSYQYFLEGYSKQWSDWSNLTQKEFTNLSQGSYRFLVRAKVNEESISQTTAFEFTILPPWYANSWAFPIYLIMVLLLISLVRHFYQLKLEKHRKHILQNLAIANEQERVRLRNEQLQADLGSKTRELANSAMNIVYKNELLQKIRGEMVQLKDSRGEKMDESQLKKIQKVIDEGMSDDRDWNVFETSFNEAHENFFKKLKISYSALVPNDLKLCAFLRMNMNSKEIASLLNITLRGVEIRRYRLRKKLNLEHDKNMVEFLIEL